MHSSLIGRATPRHFIVTLSALASLALPACSQRQDPAMHTHAHDAPAADGIAPAGDHAAGAAGSSADAALARLQAGNERFLSGKMRHPHETGTWRAGLEAAQHPFATVIGCSDSRVPLELLFDQGFGDLFVIRVAGNLVARDEAGSIEYAVVHLHTPLVAVIGHEGCGAVTAALGTHEEIMSEPAELSDLLAAIHVGMPEIPMTLPQSERVARGVEANVRHAMMHLRRIPSLRAAIASGETRVVGGIYNLHDGRVRWLD
jgi:carbonic anhydrase